MVVVTIAVMAADDRTSPFNRLTPELRLLDSRRRLTPVGANEIATLIRESSVALAAGSPPIVGAMILRRTDRRDDRCNTGRGDGAAARRLPAGQPNRSRARARL